ncbi:MAG TPA: hypothetical protein VH596_06415 [Terriglobales bacterium]
MELKNRIRTLVMIGLMVPGLFSQQTPKPLTNDDVITMVKNGMPESVVVSAIQSRSGKFSTSTSELVRLHKAGVTENELNAMIGVSSKGSASQAAVPAPAAAPAVPKSRKPTLSVTSGNTTQVLQLEKTQLAETKTKPSSMKSLASDSVVAQAMQAGVNEAGMAAAMHMNYGVGGESVQQAGTIFSSVMSHRQPKVTYVWGVPGPASSNVLQSAAPSFTLDFSRVLGVTSDDYAPVIVKLTPAQSTCRIIGATQGKADASSSPAADWQIYSNFLEERVNSQLQKLAPGKYKLAPASELAAGEYGVVLRPISKAKKFSGGDVARGQGDGLMFDAVWTFQISEDAQ